MLTTTRRSLILSLLALPCAFGYITQTTTVGGQTYTIQRTDNQGISFFLNDKVAASPNLSNGSDPAAAAQAALTAWNSVKTANIHFNDLQTTSTGHDSSDCKSIIVVASTAGDISVVGGALAITVTQYSQSAGAVCGGKTSSPPGTITDTDIVFTSILPLSTNSSPNTADFQSVLTHELGHALGANHSGLVGATMFWATTNNQLNQRAPSSDDVAFVNALYPAEGLNPGTLSGKISLADGSPVKFGLITALDQTTGTAVGGLTAADGTYSLSVPAGSYLLGGEPFNSLISPGNIYTETGGLSSGQVTGGFLPTFLGGSASPTATAVAAGKTTTANLPVTAGSSTLTAPFYGIGAAGANGDIGTSVPLTGLAAAISIPSGQSVDIGMGQGGIDTTTTFLVFGRGISIKPGSIHADTKVSLGTGAPLMRFTLVIPAQTETTLATLWIVKGNNILAFSGGLVITPAAPTITNVLDAESARGAVTSGQWTAIYGNNLARSTRSWGAADFTGGTAVGAPLPKSLDGVSVSVNSTPASVYFVCSACSPNQINFLTPSDLPNGKATVAVTNNGVASAPFTINIVPASPSFFYYAAGTRIYALGVHINNGVTVGDPAALAGTEKAHPGETIELFANGIAPSPGDSIVAVTPYAQQVTVSAGSFPLTVSQPYLVAAGEFQINVTLPSTMTAGTYTLTMTVPGGSTSDSGLTVVLPVGP